MYDGLVGHDVLYLAFGYLPDAWPEMIVIPYYSARHDGEFGDAKFVFPVQVAQEPFHYGLVLDARRIPRVFTLICTGAPVISLSCAEGAEDSVIMTPIANDAITGIIACGLFHQAR